MRSHWKCTYLFQSFCWSCMLDCTTHKAVYVYTFYCLGNMLSLWAEKMFVFFMLRENVMNCFAGTVMNCFEHVNVMNCFVSWMLWNVMNCIADDSCRVKTYIYWSHFFLLLFLKLLLNLFFNMVVTRSQLESLSKDELIDRLLQIVNIEDKLEHLNKRFDDFLGKYD